MNILTQFAQNYSTYEYDYSTTAEAATTAALTPAMILFTIFFILIVGLATYAIGAYLLSRIFKKAGVKQWIAWVPFYNTWKMLELGGQQGFWAVLAILPVVSYVSLVFMYIAMYRIGLNLGKEGWWVVLAIFVPIIWIAILAFDSSKWQVKQTV
jgi:uncharacterized membrane protein YoaK (UPF0700 family)